MKVLIADSDASARRFVRLMLSRAQGIEVLEASDVDDALDLIALENPQLLLLALCMLGSETVDRGGIEILQRVRVSGINTPAVMIANALEVADVRVAIQLGISDYLLRWMITPEFLVPIVERLCNRHSTSTVPIRHRSSESSTSTIHEEPPPAVHAPAPAPLTAPAVEAKARVETVHETAPLMKPGFFGRAKELRQLEEFLASEKSIGIVTGVAGIGKTTVVREFVHRNAESFPGGAVHLSARSIPVTILSASSLLLAPTCAVRGSETGRPPNAANRPSTDALRDSTIADRLTGLIVFDDLDAVPALEITRLIGVFERLPPGKSKVLLVVREVAPQLQERFGIVDMAGLDGDAATMLVQHLAEQRELPDLVNAEEARKLAIELRGHPIAIDLAVRTTMDCHLWKAAPRIYEIHWQNIVMAAVKNTGRDGRWLLERILQFPDSSFTREELEVAATASMMWPDDIAGVEQRVSAGLAACLASGLVVHDATHDVYRMPHGVEGYLRDDLSLRARKWNPLESLSVLAAAFRYVREHHGNFEAIDRRFEHLFLLFDTMSNMSGIAEEICYVVALLGPYLINRKQWSIRELWEARLRGFARQRDRSRSDRVTNALQLLGRIPALARSRDHAGFAMSLEQLTEELRYLNVAVDVAPLRERAAALAEMVGSAVVLERLARQAWELRDFRRARGFFTRAVEAAASHGDRQQENNILRWWARLEGLSSNVAEARALVERYVRHDVGASDTNENAYRAAILREWIRVTADWGNGPPDTTILLELGRLERKCGRYSEARMAFAECVRLRRELRSPHGLAEALVASGECEFDAGFVSEGLAHLHEAKAILERQKDADTSQIQAIIRALERTARGRRIARAMTRDDAPTNEPAPSGAAVRARRIILRGHG